MRLLLLVQSLLITCLLIFSALLRLTLPVAPSTAVMTGNLTNACLALVDANSRTPLMMRDTERH
jgi:hypothetical protein